MMSHPYPLPYPAPTSSAPVTRPSFLSVACRIYSHDGPTGFFRGLGLCLLRAVPVNACAFFVYEGILRGLGAEKVMDSFVLGLTQ
jgi:solute carrier family 25 carnitine/acylcarnitine transporter 20/29